MGESVELALDQRPRLLTTPGAVVGQGGSGGQRQHNAEYEKAPTERVRHNRLLRWAHE